MGPLCRGPVWMPITPKRGFFLHADSTVTMRSGKRRSKKFLSDCGELGRAAKGVDKRLLRRDIGRGRKSFSV